MMMLWCNVSVLREAQLHEQLRLSKRLTDAVALLNNCLEKTKTSLNNDRTRIHGDLHTVYALIDDHQV